jgi:threonine/homoserine/homoserine lactone efflux protein
MVVNVPEPSTIVLFAAAALALLVIPGPSVLYIVTSSAEHGWRAGLASVAGVHLGSVVHIGAAAVGLSAVLVRSAAAYQVVKYAGAAYLVYIGVRRLLGRDRTPIHDSDSEQDAGVPTARLFWRGAMVNVLNPKTALFFLAFLPQFVDPERGAVALQAVVLGAVFIVLGFCSDGAYALAAAHLAGRVRRRLRAGLRWTGAVYVALGATAALQPRTATTTK